MNYFNFMEERISARFEKARVKHVAVHKKEPLALVAIYNGDFELWNTSSISIVKSGTIGEMPIRACAFLEEIECFLIGADDGVLRLYCLDKFEIKCKVQAHTDFIRHISVHPTLSYVATCADDMSIKIWDYSKELSLLRSLEAHTHYVMCAEFSPKDGRMLISCSMDHSIRLWNIETGRNVGVMEDAKIGQNSVAFITDKYVVSGGDDGRIHVWDISNGSLITSVGAHTGPITSIYVSTRGFLTTGEDGLIREWNKKRFRPESSLFARLQRVWGVAQTQSGGFIAGGDGGICFIHKGQSDSIYTFKSTDNSARIVYSEDTTLKHIKTGNHTAQKVISTLAYIPDRVELSDSGRYIAVEIDGMVTVYTLLGFLQQISVPGQSLVWTGAEDFLLVYNGQIVQYIEFEIEGRVSIEVEGAVAYIRKISNLFIFVKMESGMGYICTVEGKIVYEKKDAISAYVNEEVFVFILTTGIEIVWKKERATYSCNISSWCARKSVLFVKSGTRTSYFIIPDRSLPKILMPTPFEGVPGKGVIIGVTDDLWYIDEEKPQKSSILWELVRFQEKIVSGEVPEKIPKDLSKECVQFLIGAGMLREAMELTEDTNERFDLHIRLGELIKAKDIADTEIKYSKLCKLFVEKGDLLNALECAKKGNSVENEILLCSLCNDIQGLSSASERAYNQGKILVALAAAHRSGNISVCEKVFKNTPFESLFVQAYKE